MKSSIDGSRIKYSLNNSCSSAANQHSSRRQSDELEEAPFLTTLGTYCAYIVLYLVGTLREFMWGTGPLNGNSEAFRLVTLP